MTAGTSVRGAAALAPLLANRDRVAIAARAIEPLLNRVVFTGRQVVPWLETSPVSSGARPTFAADAVVRVLSTGELDRLAADLRRAGLTHAARTAMSDRWVVNESVTLDFTYVSGDESDPGAVWLEYASLLTTAVNVGTADQPLSARITGAPALVALDWAAYRASGESALDSGELEDIVALVATRAEIVREIGAAPPELRTFVAGETRRFLESGSAPHVIRSAVPDARRLPAITARVMERLRSIASPG